MTKITKGRLKSIIQEAIREVEGDDMKSVYRSTSTPLRQSSPADRPSAWSVVASYEKGDLRPGDRVVQSSRGTAAMASHKSGVRLHMTPDWGPSAEDTTNLPWGAAKLVELETGDGTVGFAPAHWFVKV